MMYSENACYVKLMVAILFVFGLLTGFDVVFGKTISDYPPGYPFGQAGDFITAGFGYDDWPGGVSRDNPPCTDDDPSSGGIGSPGGESVSHRDFGGVGGDAVDNKKYGGGDSGMGGENIQNEDVMGG
ncbi:MAG: hypothetical protein KJ645_09345, partial [Planctomycetes bacterium]|nr:hypothetical protein [Planctomycetota bacterium]